MKTKIFCLLLLCMCGMTAMAQKLSGRVIDDEMREPMPGTTVMLLNAKDSAKVATAITDTNGKFTLPSQKTGDYILKISFVGFRPIMKNMSLTKSNKGMDLGTFALLDDAKMMKDAVVTAALAQVEVKGDTFQYNADAFKTTEGSSIEELVRLIPGAEVDENGNITINGKTVSRVLVKGKEFFGNDKDMSMKNLPAKMVDKIKAYDRKSDYTRITGIDDGNEETVLDLSFKRSMSDGWVFNIDLGGGHARQDEIPGEKNPIKFPDLLYTGNLNINRFTDNLQFNVIASRNNTNGGSGRWGGFSGGSGVTTTMMVGVNLTWFNGKEQYTPGYFEAGGNIRYNTRDTENMSVGNSEKFVTQINKFPSFTNNRNWSKSGNNNLNADLRMQWMPDSFTTITIRPSFTHSENNSEGRNVSATFDSNPYDVMENPLEIKTKAGKEIYAFDDDDLFADEIRVNSNQSQSRGLGTTNSGNATLQVNRRLAKPGRNITMDLGGNFSNSDNDNYNWSVIKYYKSGMPNRTQDRFTTSPSKSWNANGRISYTEPLGDYLNLQMSYQYQRRFTDNERNMYSLEKLIGQSLSQQGLDKYGDGISTMMTEDILRNIFEGGLAAGEALDNMMQIAGYGTDWQSFTRDAVNSQYATYKENNHNANLLLRYTNIFENGQELRASAGVTFQPQNTHMDYKKNQLDTVVTRTTYNWSPRVDARWKINNVSQLRMSWNGRMSQPSITQLMEVTDDSNPLSVNTGNSGLRSSWANNVSLDYNGYYQEQQMSWTFRGSYNNTRNNISSASVYDPMTGARYTRPENIDGNWGASAGGYFSTALGYDKFWNFSNNLNFNYNYRLGYTNNSNLGHDVIVSYIGADGRMDMDALFRDPGAKITQASRTTGVSDNMRLNYRYTFYDDRWSVDFTVNGGFNYSHTEAENSLNGAINSWMINYGGNFTIRMPWQIAWMANFTEQSRRGYSDKAMNTNEALLNMTLQKSFLRGNAATISVEWNDILHQRSNVSRMISEIQRSDSFSNNINSYFMVHFIYRLNLLGDREARNMMRGMGGFGGGRGGFGGGGMGGFGGGMGGFGGGGGRF